MDRDGLEQVVVKLDHDGRIENQDDLALYSMNGAADRSLLWRQDKRILPLCALAYLLCILDRSNVGNAKVMQLNTKNNFLYETNMTDYQFTLALMIFFVIYALFEVPSNYLLKKVKPSRWIALLMIGWGAITSALGGTNSFATVMVVRLLLGLFESGTFNAIQVVTWATTNQTNKRSLPWTNILLKSEERSIRVAFIVAGAALAGAFGGTIAYGIGHMNSVSGLSAWRWLFILEGIPSCISGILILIFLPDYPETSKWLSAQEKSLAIDRLALEGSKGDAKITWKEAKATLRDWRLYGHYALYFGVCTTFSSLSLFAPSITSGLNYKGLKAQLMTAPPYAVAYVVTLLVSWSADRYNARALHSAVFAVVGGVGFLASAVLPPDSYLPRYGCLILASTGTFSCIPPLLGWLSSNLHTTGAAGLAIALNVSFGTPGLITGVWIYKANERLKGYPTGHWTNAGLLFFVAIGSVVLLAYYHRVNAMITKRGDPNSRLYKY